MIGSTPGAMLTRVEAAARLNLKVHTLAAWASRGEGPPFVKLGRAVRYPADELAAWVGAQRVVPGQTRRLAAAS